VLRDELGAHLAAMYPNGAETPSASSFATATGSQKIQPTVVCTDRAFRRVIAIHSSSAEDDTRLTLRVGSPPVWRRRWVLALTSCSVLLAVACGGGGGKRSGGTATSVKSANSAPAPAPAPASDAATLTYGYGPSTDGSAKYQPDVVAIPDGPAAIRSATGDGLTWTIAGNANGVSKLAVGSVMLATSRAVGRVVAIHDDGDNRVVTLAPVNLTEVIRDGTINLDKNFDLSKFAYLQVPDLPGAVSEPKPGDTPVPVRNAAHVITAPTVHLVASQELPPAEPKSVMVPLGSGWSVELSALGGQLGFTINHESEDALKVGMFLGFAAENLHINTGETIAGGVASGTTFLVEGIKGLDVDLSAGAGHGSVDNGKIKVEVPTNIDFPIPPGPETAFLPLDIKIAGSFIVETALTGSNATLLGTGKYKLDGPLGIRGGTVVAPTLTVEQSIIDSISGVTLGPSGLVVAVHLKLQVGLGPPAATAGPFGSVSTSLGITNGSALGAALVKCKGATLDMSVGAGAGLSLSNEVLDALKVLLPDNINLEPSVEQTTNVLHRDEVVPDIPLCH
jgi:hypothetical protein